MEPIRPARVRGPEERVVSLRRKARVVVHDVVLVAYAVPEARADLQVLERAAAGREGVGEHARHPVRAVVDVETVLTVTVEHAGRVKEEFVLGLAPHHHADLFVGGNAEAADRERALHEGDEFVARSVLHRERRVELPELDVENSVRAVVDKDVRGRATNARCLRTRILRGRRRGIGAGLRGLRFRGAGGVVERSRSPVARDLNCQCLRNSPVSSGRMRRRKTVDLSGGFTRVSTSDTPGPK